MASASVELTSMNLGFTFSQRQAEYLELAWREAYREAINLSPGTVRLGAYWDEIEPEPGRSDFSTLDWLLDKAAARDLRIILTVGLKAPRWPEYYLPAWLDRRLPDGGRVTDEPDVRVHTLDFIRQVIQRYCGREVIAYWQVENEPLDPAGRGGRRLAGQRRGQAPDVVNCGSRLARMYSWNRAACSPHHAT